MLANTRSGCVRGKRVSREGEINGEGAALVLGVRLAERD